MKQRILSMLLTVCLIVGMLPTTVFATEGATIGTSGLCEHHTAHDETCGYVEGTAETPCTHEHTEDCYKQTESCAHTHTAECYPVTDSSVSGNEATPSDAAEPTECVHECSGESGCVTEKVLDCNHEHDAACGYIAAVAGHECHFECADCAADKAAVESTPVCTCGTDDGTVHATDCPAYVAPENLVCTCVEKCTGDNVNIWCDVCGVAGMGACTAEGEAALYENAVVSSVALRNIPTGAVGTAIIDYTEAGADYTATGIWHVYNYDEGYGQASGTFESGEIYKLDLTIELNSGCTWAIDEYGGKNVEITGTHSDGSPAEFDDVSFYEQTDGSSFMIATIYVDRTTTTPIDKVTLPEDSIPQAEVGAAIPAAGFDLPVPEGSNYTAKGEWLDEHGDDASGTFEKGKLYTLDCQISSKNGCSLAELVTVYVGNEEYDTYTTDRAQMYLAFTFSLRTVISEVELTLPKAEVGQEIQAGPFTVSPAGANYEATATWLDENDTELTSGSFEKGKRYSISVNIKAGEGFEFSGELIAKVNGVSVKLNSWEVESDYASYSETYSFCEVIDKIEVNGVTAPAIGAEPAESGITVPAGANYSISDIIWYDEQEAMGSDDVSQIIRFEAGHAYLLHIEVKPAAGYEFAENVVFYMNGEIVFGSSIVTEAAVWNSWYFSEGITEVRINNAQEMKVGETARTDITYPTDAGYTASAKWEVWNDSEEYFEELESSDVFESGKTYRMYIEVKTENGYRFLGDETAFYVNGKKISNVDRDRYWTDCTLEYSEGFKLIDKVEITVSEPVTGQHASILPTVKVPDGAHYKVDLAGLDWLYGDAEAWSSFDGYFLAGEGYGVYLNLIADSGYRFADDVVVLINGDAIYSGYRGHKWLSMSYFYQAEEDTLSHSWGDWKSISDSQYQRVCEHDDSHSQTVTLSAIGDITLNLVPKVGAVLDPETPSIEIGAVSSLASLAETGTEGTEETEETAILADFLTGQGWQLKLLNGDWEEVEMPLTLEEKHMGGSLRYTLKGEWGEKHSREVALNPEGLWITGIEPLSYTGSKVTQSFQLYDGDTLLQEKVDYTLTYKNNQKAYEPEESSAQSGTSASAQGGSLARGDDLAQAGSLAQSGAGAASSVYGEGTSPSAIAIVSEGGEALSLMSEGNGVSVTDVNYYNTKTAPRVVVKMKGNYKGTYTIYFPIEKPDLSEAQADDLTVTWTGKDQKPVPVVTWEGKKLANNKDYTIAEYQENPGYTDPGDYTLTLVGKGNFKGSKTLTLTITQSAKQIAMDKVKVSGVKAQTFSLEGAKQAGLVVKYKNTVLTEKTADQAGEYTVTYLNNHKAGTATLVLTGTGEDANGDNITFKGIKKVSFKVNGTAMNKVQVTGLEKAYDYTGEELRPTDWPAQGAADTDQEGAQTTAGQEGQSSTAGQNGEDGGSRVVQLTFTNPETREVKSLVEGEDYEVSYQNNINKGTATILFTGKPEAGFTGVLKKTFKI